MKTKFICLICANILLSTSIIPLSTNAAVQSPSVDTPYETYIDLSKIEINEIESNCEDIEIATVEDIENNENITEIGTSQFDPSAVEEIGVATIDAEIVIGDIAIPLYPTFEDSGAALKKINDDCSNILSILAEKYKLERLSETNWKEYYAYMYAYLDEEDKVEWYAEDNSEYIELSIFFDIYENYDMNNDLVSEAAAAEHVFDLVESETFISGLPYYAIDALEEEFDLEVTNNYTEEINSEPQLMNLINTPMAQNLKSNNSEYNLVPMAFSQSKAITYATTYATKPNPKYGFILKSLFVNKDCTNFASQILVAGGKTPNLTWYCVPTNKDMYYTPAWASANHFAKYWGVDYRYEISHKKFSAKLKKGDFIVYDRTGDGSWNHTGYVTATSSFDSKLNYTDYKVAQHSTNYHLWTSHKDNGWENIRTQYPKSVLGIIRL